MAESNNTEIIDQRRIESELKKQQQLLLSYNSILIGLTDENKKLSLLIRKNQYQNQTIRDIVQLKDFNINQLLKEIVKFKVQVNDLKRQTDLEGITETLKGKLSNLSEFNKDLKIRLIECSFDVFEVSIKQESFDANLTSFFNLKIPSDYQIQKKGEFKFVRTKKPYAQTQQKAIYLIKNDQNEFFCLKMPLNKICYNSIDEALQGCRSHLISQKFMQKFMYSLKTTLNIENLSIPEIHYSDIFILEENNKSFFIAERITNGKFAKYNSNNGFISEDSSDLNLLAQTFTYYSYQISDFNYMISNIQGIDNYFTDPVINSIFGEFEENDLGLEGISNFAISFDDSQQKYLKYLKMLGLIYNL